MDMFGREAYVSATALVDPYREEYTEKKRKSSK